MTNTNKYVGLSLGLLFVMGAITSTAHAAGGNFGGGANGSSGNPWQIEDCLDLQNMDPSNEFRGTLGGTNTMTNEDHYRLENDIYCDATASGDQGGGDIWIGTEGFDPIGGIIASAFEAHLNMNNYKIYNLHINRPLESHVGLFRELNNTVNNIHISGGNITGGSVTGGVAGILGNANVSNFTFTGTVSGGSQVGGLFGDQSNGSMTNATVEATITGTGGSVGGISGSSGATIDNVTMLGNVSGTSSIGGIAGQTSNTISNATYTGTVAATGNYVGGIAGGGDGVSNSRAYGTVSGVGRVGGIAGQTQGGTVNNSHSTMSITGSSLVGGVVGEAQATITNSSHTQGTINGGSEVGGVAGKAEANMNKSFHTGPINAGGKVGGVIGAGTSATIEDVYHLGNINATGARVGGVLGFVEDSITFRRTYAAGNVTGASKTGGVVGAMEDAAIVIQNSYFKGDVTNGGEILGYCDNDNLGNCNASRVTNSFYEVGSCTGGNCGAYGATVTPGKELNTNSLFEHYGDGTLNTWDFSTAPVWKYVASQNEDYPALNWQTTYYTAPVLANAPTSLVATNTNTLNPTLEALHTASDSTSADITFYIYSSSVIDCQTPGEAAIAGPYTDSGVAHNATASVSVTDNLTDATSYVFCAEATNGAGTAYSTAQSFSILTPAAPTSIEDTETAIATSGAITQRKKDSAQAKVDYIQFLAGEDFNEALDPTDTNADNISNALKLMVRDVFRDQTVLDQLARTVEIFIGLTPNSIDPATRSTIPGAIRDWRCENGLGC